VPHTRVRMLCVRSSSSVTIDVLDSETATVRVSAADRPGLLQDVASAISGVGLTVESGEVTTPMDSFALNSFTVKVGADGTSWPEAASSVRSSARCCLVSCWLPRSGIGFSSTSFSCRSSMRHMRRSLHDITPQVVFGTRGSRVATITPASVDPHAHAESRKGSSTYSQ